MNARHEQTATTPAAQHTNAASAQTGAEGVAAPHRTPADAPSQSTSANDATTPAAPATTTPDDDGADARRALLRAILRTLPIEARAVLLAALAAWVLSMRAAVQVLGAVGAMRPPTRPGESLAASLAASAVTMTAKDAAKAMMRAGCDALMESPVSLDATPHANACAAVWFHAAVYGCEQRYPLPEELDAAAGDVEALMSTVRDALEVRAIIASRGYDPATVLRDAVPAAGIGVLAVEMPPESSGPRWYVRDDIAAELHGCGRCSPPVVVRLPMPAEGERPGAPSPGPGHDPSQGAPDDAHHGEALDIGAELRAIVRDAARLATVENDDGARAVCNDVAMLAAGDDSEALPSLGASLARHVATMGVQRFTRGVDAADNAPRDDAAMELRDAAFVARDTFALASRVAGFVLRSLDGALRVEDVRAPPLL